MSNFICIVPVCPIRQHASHRAEQVSQLLFGEKCVVIMEENDFAQIKTTIDGYTGWCQRSQIAMNTGFSKNESTKLTAGWSNEISCNGKPMIVPLGSQVSHFENGSWQIDQQQFTYTGDVWDVKPALFSKENIDQIAMRFLNTSYQWGGRSVFGIDCSGFTQMVYSFFGFALLRDASMQATQGQVIGFLQEAKCGDLAFFDNAEGTITHVGVLLSPDIIIHASGKVRIDNIDNEGIVNEDGNRTHKLRIIKRIVEY